MNKAVFGLFQYVDSLLDAAERLKRAGCKVTVFSPIPIGHEIEERLGKKKDYVKFFPLAGSVFGFFFGIALAFGTAALYVLPRGGRAIFPITPTLIISYETTILIGVVFTYVGFLLMSRLPSYKKRTYLPEVSVDSFGLLVEDKSGMGLGGVGGGFKKRGARGG